MAFSELRLYTTKACVAPNPMAAAPVVGGACAARAEMAEAKFMVEICFSFGKSSLCDWKVLYWSMGTTFCTLGEFQECKKTSDVQLTYSFESRAY